MKNTAAIALLVARAAAQDRADMAADHAFVRPATVFQAAALEASCTDAGVTTAKSGVTAAEEDWTAVVVLKKAADALVTTELGRQTEAITALNAANPVQVAGAASATPAEGSNAALIKADVDADLLVLTTALAMNELEVTKTAKEVELVAKKAEYDTAKAADDAADTVKAAADTAKTEATKHKLSIDAQVPAARAAVNASMKAWTGVVASVDASVVWTSQPASYYEARATANTAISTGDDLSALETEAYKLQALKVAVGSCTKDATPATYGGSDYTTCSSAAAATPALSLVRLALRQKGVEEEKAKAEAEQTAVLDAFCLASMALGVPVAELAAGTEYRAQMLPGVRTDFAFIGDTTAKAKIDGTAPDVFATLGKSMAETDSVPYVSGTNNAEKALLKCEKATKASRSYTGDNAAITAALALLPYGILTAKQALAGDGLTVGASVALQSAFVAWKAKTDDATAAYDVMISTDALVEATATKACATTGNVVATPIANAKAALVAVTTSNAARPSNLVATITATDTKANYVAACNVECAKLPSWGLKLNTAGSANTYPTAITEVCQGTSSQYTAANSLSCAFMSGATESGGNSAVAATGDADDATKSCWKRAAAKGLLWRTAVIAAATGLDAAGGTTAGYPAVNALYTTWSDAIIAWKTTREAVMDAFGNYLAEKEIVTKCGAAVLAMDVKVQRLTARLDGTTGGGGDITNEPYKKKYKADWLLAFYTTAAKTETTAAALSADYAAGYAVGTAVNTLPDVLHGRTDLEAVWLTAVAATATAKATYDAGKADYDDRIMAQAAQATLLAQATTDAGTSVTAVGAASPAPTGTAGALSSATTALGTELTFAAYEALDDAARTATAAGAYKTRNAAAFAHKTAETAWTSAKNALALLQDNKADGTLSATMAAYRALQTLRATADAAVSATTAAIVACDTAAGVVDKELAKVNTARLDHRAAVTKCMNTKYESYKTTMSQAVAQQKTDIQTIKALLDAKVTPAAGATGARCEKGLSQGNGRAARAQPCTAETDCCGAAKGPVVPVATWADAPLMTIEICQASSAKTYSYVAPRAPMATTEPAGTDWPFACIDGASKLAAAATALATTAYMMA